MKNQKAFVLPLATAMLIGTLAAPASALAAENTNVGKTTVTVTKKTEPPTYTLTVPAKLEVTQAGFTATKDAVKVTTEEAENFTGTVEVLLKSGNENKFISTENTKAELAYKIKKNADAKEALDVMVFQMHPDDVRENDSYILAEVGDTGATFGVDIAESDWNAAPDGTYEDVITFTAEYFAG